MTNPVGRLAFRVEGNYWVAYYALADTMDGALELGRIAMGAVRPPHDKRKKEFMDMMRSIVTETFAERIDSPVKWDDPILAPEHERK